MAEEEPQPIAIGIAMTLLGAISFQMALMYLTNHSDKDMRRYTYGVINQTVSIFCAVLLFQTFDDVVEWLFLEGVSLQLQAFVDMLHMLAWFTILQTVLAWICGVACFEKRSDEMLEKEAQSKNMEKDELIESMTKDLKCWSVLLAHLTGFASINAWGALQQMELFSSNPALSFCILPASAIGLFFLEQATDWYRESTAMSSGDKDKKEETWDEECEEAENDVMGLTLSFNLTQALRYLITGELPNQHGKEPDGTLHTHTTDQVVQLYLVGAACIVAMVVVFLHVDKKKEEKAEDGDEVFQDSEDDEEDEEPLGSDHDERGEEKERKDGEEESQTERWNRFLDALTITFAMAFAWCVFYAFQMGLARIEILHDPMVLAVSLTLAISFVAFACIRGLDLLDDLLKDASNQVVAKAVRNNSMLWIDTKAHAHELSAVFARPVHGGGKGGAGGPRTALKLQRSVFTIEERELKGAGRKGANGQDSAKILLKHGNLYLCRDGAMRHDRRGKDQESPYFDRIIRNHNDYVRIRVMDDEFDLIPKESKRARTMDQVIKKIIRAMGILVGFGWEQCFDQAVEELSSVCPNPHLAKMALAFFCIVIIVPAWKWYVLPMAEQEGWKFGFVVDHDHEKWNDVALALQHRRPAGGGEAPGAALGHGGGRGSAMSVLQSRKKTLLRELTDGRMVEIEPLHQPLLQMGAQDSYADVEGQPSVHASADVARRLPAGAAADDLARLRETQDNMKQAAEGFLDLYMKLKQTAGKDRKHMLKMYNEQMDQMLGRMVQIQAQVARDTCPSPRLPGCR